MSDDELSTGPTISRLDLKDVLSTLVSRYGGKKVHLGVMDGDIHVICGHIFGVGGPFYRGPPAKTPCGSLPLVHFTTSKTYLSCRASVSVLDTGVGVTSSLAAGVKRGRPPSAFGGAGKRARRSTASVLLGADGPSNQNRLSDNNAAVRARIMSDLRASAQKNNEYYALYWDAPSFSPFIKYVLAVKNRRVLFVLHARNEFDAGRIRLSTVCSVLQAYTGLPTDSVKGLLRTGESGSTVSRLAAFRLRTSFATTVGPSLADRLWVFDNVEFCDRVLLCAGTFFYSWPFLGWLRDGLDGAARRRLPTGLSASAVRGEVEKRVVALQVPVLDDLLKEFGTTPDRFVFAAPGDPRRINSSYFHCVETLNGGPDGVGLSGVDGLKDLRWAYVRFDDMYRALRTRGDTAVACPPAERFKYGVLVRRGVVVDCGRCPVGAVTRFLYSLRDVHAVESELVARVSNACVGYGAVSRLAVWTVSMPRRAVSVLTSWLGSGNADGTGVLSSWPAPRASDTVVVCRTDVFRAALSKRAGVRVVGIPTSADFGYLGDAHVVILAEPEHCSIHDFVAVIPPVGHPAWTRPGGLRIVIVGSLLVLPLARQVGMPFRDLCAVQGVPSHSTDDEVRVVRGSKDAAIHCLMAYAGTTNRALFRMVHEITEDTRLVLAEDEEFTIYRCSHVSSLVRLIACPFDGVAGTYLLAESAFTIPEESDVSVATRPGVGVFHGGAITHVCEYDRQLRQLNCDTETAAAGSSRDTVLARRGRRVVTDSDATICGVVACISAEWRGKVTPHFEAQRGDTSRTMSVRAVHSEVDAEASVVSMTYSSGVSVRESVPCRGYRGPAFDWVVLLFDRTCPVCLDDAFTVCTLYARKGIILVGDDDLILANLTMDIPCKTTAFAGLLRDRVAVDSGGPPVPRVSPPSSEPPSSVPPAGMSPRGDGDSDVDSDTSGSVGCTGVGVAEPDSDDDEDGSAATDDASGSVHGGEDGGDAHDAGAGAGSSGGDDDGNVGDGDSAFDDLLDTMV